MPRPRADGRPSAASNRRALTELFVQRVEPKAEPYLVWDTRQRGLVLVVRPSGKKSFKAAYAFRGRRRWYALAEADAIKLDEARRLAGRVMFQVAEGTDPQAERAAQRDAGSFEELHERYVEQHAKKKNRSWKQADALVRNHLRPRWNKLLAADITRGDVRAAIARLETPAVQNQVLASASAIFAWAVKNEVAGIRVNPCTGVDRNVLPSRDRVLSDSELPIFWNAFEDAGPIRGLALKLILLTGQRPGEVQHMRREHIVDGWWELPGAPDPKTEWPGVKNGNSHRVWLPTPAMDLLRELLDESREGFVFPGERGGQVKGLSEAMAGICAEHELPRATPHDLRRTFATRVASLGFGRDAVDRLLNHSKRSEISTVYIRHSYAGEDKRIMEATAAELMALVQGRQAVNLIPLIRPGR